MLTLFTSAARYASCVEKKTGGLCFFKETGGPDSRQPQGNLPKKSRTKIEEDS
jgi:hypothetical protein